MEKKKKPKYVYKTADQLIASGGAQRKGVKGTESELAKVKVIDMTGKEQRVLSGNQIKPIRYVCSQLGAFVFKFAFTLVLNQYQLSMILFGLMTFISVER